MDDKSKIEWLEGQLTKIASHPCEGDKVFIDSDFFRPSVIKEYNLWKKAQEE